MFSLHYIYLSRIQRAVTEFRDQRNHHALRTERHRRPLQLWCEGMITTNQPSLTDNNGALPAENSLLGK